MPLYHFEAEEKSSPIKAYLKDLQDYLNKINSQMEHEYEENYNKSIKFAFSAIYHIMHFGLFITLKAPLLLLHGMTLTITLLFEKLSVILFSESIFDIGANFTDISSLIEAKFNRPLITTEELPDHILAIGGSKKTDNMFSNILTLVSDKLSAELPYETKDKVWLLFGKSLIVLFGAIALPLTFICTCINQFIIEKLLDYAVPGLAQYGARTLFNVISSLPLMIYHRCQSFLNKNKQAPTKDACDDLDIPTSSNKTENSLKRTTMVKAPANFPSPTSKHNTKKQAGVSDEDHQRTNTPPK